MDKILFIDTETGGLDPQKHSLLSLGLVVWEKGELVDKIEILVNDGKLAATNEALEINKINLDEHKINSLSPNEVINQIIYFIKKNFTLNQKITLAGHNINFDVNFLKHFLSQNKLNFEEYFSHRFIDTSSILYYLYLSGKLKQRAFSSSEAFEYFGIRVDGRHTALGDAIATAKLFTNLIQLTKKNFKKKIDKDNGQYSLNI